ncbi:gfo/Idh/MocA family oxidoreductase [Campylobacter insulaenigrae]|uniref:gfo/Idh/MocA family oxidoreductase n=1 Tax=Campylobacter insulaenigrae TaxID=260714 RepID=UPI002153A5D0|nr:gfo/Idh/MocA family oxidoreductase [Campylobacter insulaenigrae]MCR6594905.1 gfo/Idh/MocA family oxidoreductase [Campylobacter insulaenigrae]
MKALIVGYGSIAKKHFLAMKSLGYEISVVSKYLDDASIKSYKNLDELDLNFYDLFVICNITTKHYETLKYIDEKVKDKIILVEKPLFEKYKILNTNNTIYVAYLLRFNSLVQRLKELVDTDKNIYFTKFICGSYLPNWRECDYTKNYSAKKDLGGGVLLDLSHEIDLAFYFFQDLTLLYSQRLKLSELKIDSDDFSFLSLQSKRSLIHIELDYFSKFIQRKIIFHSSEYSYEANLIENTLKIYNTNHQVEIQNFKNDTINTLKNLHINIARKSQDLCDYSQASKILKLCDEVHYG